MSINDQLPPPERMLVESWTDDEWLTVLAALPPSADIREGVAYVNELRAQALDDRHRAV